MTCVYYFQAGNFPLNFVEEIALPPLQANQHLYAAVKTFTAEQDGDLGFKKGEEIT